MGTIHEVIEAFRQAPSNSERGTKFEKLMVRYFELDPTQAQEYDAVWRWIDYPDRQGKPDTGIDLVARSRDTGELTAIQCKFYEPEHNLSKGDIDSFFTALGKAPFTKGIIISTTDKWGKNAEDALEDQSKPVSRLSLAEIAGSPIDWQVEWAGDDFQVTVEEAARHEPRPHQRTAVDKVFAGFGVGNERGKLIMACGTGKTFTSLKIAERTAQDNGGRAFILFCVPSISLLSQTLREWTAQTTVPLRAFAVCSDTKVSRAAEDSKVHDVAIPVTTKADQLAAAIAAHGKSEGLTVVFTTYQSLPAVSGAQGFGAPEFDLALCDEAHRTTGVTLSSDPESNFVRIHDSDFIKATRRLYMTATPRIYDEKVKGKAEEHSAEITSMDNEELYGPEFHHLPFGEAVEKGLLTDYKVLVLTVDQNLVAGPMQSQLAGPDNELNLDDATRIVGCWNGLAKRAGATVDGTGFAPGENPMRRAVAFAKDIASSKQVAEMFPRVVDAYRDTLDDDSDDDTATTNNPDLYCSVQHVDGTFNALQRNARLSWLKAPLAENECRILTNARCLSEGVDVPALDAVLFLHPRNSIVDVVQSVGRVMRKAEGKNYGYIILPVAVPADMSPSQALSDNRRFKVVWDVLNALRAHDERFDAHVNSIALNTGKNTAKSGKGSNALLGGHVGGADPKTDESLKLSGESSDTDSGDGSSGFTSQMALFSLSQWREAIFARIVDKVGKRAYWEDWAHDVAGISAALITRIKVILDQGDKETAKEFERFLKGLRDNLNDSISEADAISMLSQHLITKPVFDALFEGHDFASHNPVSKVMQRMVDTLGGSGLESETNDLEKFYDSVRIRASEVNSAEGKQQVIAELYERFFKIGFAKQAEALGIVYTPVQVVDWILHAADTVSRQHFGKGLTDENVHILDPFVGTGMFVTRLMQTGLIIPKDLARKYAGELHANEIMLLAYYVAAVNIESTYHALTGKTEGDEYEPFPGIVLADTFQISESDDTFDAEMFPQNNERITKQLATKINVIVANPPYSVGQDSANDNNANIKYPTLDKHIENTYAKRSTATNKNSLYDSYIRAFRWASNRIGDTGVVAFVSNGGWIDGNTQDGMRLALAADYSDIYVYNLRGNQRTAGELSRREGGKVFGGGSRNTVAIFIGVKDPTATGPCTIHYRDIGDYLSRDDKLRILDSDDIEAVEWELITPNKHGDWINQRDDNYSTYPPIGERKPKQGQVVVFKSFSRGLETARDAWVYNYSSATLKGSVTRLISNYNSLITPFEKFCAKKGVTKPNEATVNAFLADNPSATDPSRINWSRSLRAHLARGVAVNASTGEYIMGTYRPFNTQNVYFDKHLNHERSRMPSAYPTSNHKNIGVVLTAPASHFEFTPFITRLLPNLHTLDTGQFFPRYTYETVEPDDGTLDLSTENGDVDEWGYRRVDNITDDILKLYREALGEDKIAKDDIFEFVYGLLHSPSYRTKYAADLKKMLPRIPTPSSLGEFEQFRLAGRQLMVLHADYETAEPYPLDVQLKKGADPQDRETWRVEKMKWKSKTDHSSIVYSPKVTVSGIPDDAERYMLGSRSALGWIIDRYQVKTDKDSGIVNDPNDWCDEHDDPTYIVDLIKKVTTVAVGTMQIVDSLP
ncbi:helicase [Mycobacteroides abscessus subsp. massiliense]|uniref:DEAD/DEAH box helicase n=1 Tax=Mycobacteroides abscessus TaxID=36809 RepID=UPI0009A77213|nr:DEAD/DEAH box helicase [Mycobacteroides abscessus]SKR54876.1 helicase [Mycobacteroides abscessus subsp. massiliense]SKR62749.1 helicase [Mycobacteroides abscessus subsp. massiliense]SKT67631.1 helicase [Mycobacteroides abscessus subsp. massiliense]SKT85990.1 helicase [Mycobacteroides abscessus subsp. massiliense]SLA02327.1 helicase [Mycobacteroides abscessus subsp. massiliense]